MVLDVTWLGLGQSCTVVDMCGRLFAIALLSFSPGIMIMYRKAACRGVRSVIVVM